MKILISNSGFIASCVRIKTSIVLIDLTLSTNLVTGTRINYHFTILWMHII